MANVLIVEDDKDLNAAYQLILRREKHTVESAHDGDEAMTKLKKFKPDLILLDLLMPVKSGIDFLQSYDSAHKHKNVKIVIFTNLENSPEITKAFDLGADKCVLKSWTAPQGLIKVVNDTLKKPKATALTA